METLGKLLTSTWAAAISAIMLVVVYVWNPSAVETLQLKTFDYFITSLDSKESEEIVLVEFNIALLAVTGQTLGYHTAPSD